MDSEPPVYALEGSVAIAGAAFSWLRDNLNILPNYSDAQNVAQQADTLEQGDVYFVPAFSGLYAPYWQQDARGYPHIHLKSEWISILCFFQCNLRHHRRYTIVTYRPCSSRRCLLSS